MSPTRPPSVRKRQSMQIMDLQSQIDQLAEHNQSLEDAKIRAEETLQATQHQRQVDEQLVAEAVEARDREIHQRDIDIAQLKDTLQRLHEEIARLTELNNTLAEANRNLVNDTNERYAQLQSEGQLVQQQWQTSQRELEQLRSEGQVVQQQWQASQQELEQLRSEGQVVQQQWQASQQEIEKLRTQHDQMTRGMEGVVRDEIGIALDDRNAEIDRLNTELAGAKEQIKTLQKQILASKKPAESFLTIRDEDYFDSACQQLCQHVQQWVLRFSKFSDTRPCRLSSEIAADTRIDTATRQKIDTRLDNAILDGSDVDSLLADRVKRRDVFMSVVMTMIWEYVFTRYLFGMDREQRQKLKALEKTLSEVGKFIDPSCTRSMTNIVAGPPRAVAQWRAITLTLLSRREAFMQQRAQDTEAVVHEIYSTLSTLLAPPSQLQSKIQESLRNVMRLAVELSIEMRTQRAEYIMLPPLQPEYDTNGDLLAKVTFNASLMNERSGRETSNDELEARAAIVKIVLFPLVVKKGDDFGEGEDEIVVCPAQVLVARPKDKKVVRMLSGAMSTIDRPDSRASRMTGVTSVVPESSIMDYHTGNVI
jgi:predicted  nucleic acid-binding Zn-ribbon protein